MMLHQQMIDEIGRFDEETFGAGYGEENDLCIRARKAGWRLLIADDTYVFHNESRSYGHDSAELDASGASRRGAGPQA